MEKNTVSRSLVRRARTFTTQSPTSTPGQHRRLRPGRFGRARRWKRPDGRLATGCLHGQLHTDLIQGEVRTGQLIDPLLHRGCPGGAVRQRRSKPRTLPDGVRHGSLRARARPPVIVPRRSANRSGAMERTRRARHRRRRLPAAARRVVCHRSPRHGHLFLRRHRLRHRRRTQRGTRFPRKVVGLAEILHSVVLPLRCVRESGGRAATGSGGPGCPRPGRARWWSPPRQRCSRIGRPTSTSLPPARG